MDLRLRKIDEILRSQEDVVELPADGECFGRFIIKSLRLLTSSMNMTRCTQFKTSMALRYGEMIGDKHERTRGAYMKYNIPVHRITREQTKAS